MKKTILSIGLAAVLSVPTLNADVKDFLLGGAGALLKADHSNDNSPFSVVDDGVAYLRYRNGHAVCYVNPQDRKTVHTITIKPRVTISGEVCVVDRIETRGFAECGKLKHVTIPSTVKEIGALAFLDDKNLTTVEIQSTDVDFEVSTEKWTKGWGVFYGCNALYSVIWPGDEIPSTAFQAFNGNKKAPYVKWNLAGKTPQSTGPNKVKLSKRLPDPVRSVPTEVPSFKSYLDEKVTGAYNAWQKKKAYESAGQYAERTSAANREQKKRELYENTKNEYISLYTPRTLNGSLTDYDTDYKVYTVEVPRFGEIFAQVPVADRSFFEDNWGAAEIVPTFNVVDNELRVVSCEYRIGDRTFYAPELFNDKGDDLSAIEFDARQLDLDELIAEESTSSKPVSSPVNTAPTTGIHNDNTYALIIGNENYKYVEPVGYALSDATTFARYCRNTLGIPMRNIIAVQDVTKGELRRTVREMQGLFEDDGAKKNLVVYYAGHGIPDAKNADSMILPVDASASDPESCYSLQEFYNTIGDFGAGNVVVYMDACFTGSTRKGTSMVASRAGVDFTRSSVQPKGNTVVISATSADETAQPYNEKGHGIFTYFLLEKLQQSQGNVSLGELADYVTTKVKSQSMRATGKRQVPSTMVSPTFKGDWRNLPVTLHKK